MYGPQGMMDPGQGMSGYYQNVNTNYKPGPSINSDLVTKALNYHGQQLTSFFKETKLFEELDLKNVDYHEYHQRSKELRMEDRGKRLLLHRFISQNAEKLFKENTNSKPNHDCIKLDNDQIEELAALLPPYEVFTNVHEDDRCRHFFDAVTAGDVLLCRVVQKSMSGLMLSVLCLDPVTSKSRYIQDLKIRCFCPSGEMIPASDPKDPVRSYETGDIVRVVCLEVKMESQRLLAGMKVSGLRPEMAGVVKLGLCDPAQLPSAFSYSSQAKERKIPFSMFLEKSVGFINPTNVSHLASELGLDVKGDSMMNSLSGKYRSECYASNLRKEQASKWAYKHVAQGIKYFKAGNNVEAFQCLNQALNIDADNVEGLVARGALYANNGGLDKAVEDFEKALTINRNHKNARKYLCETLIAVARNHEDENKVDAAIETYQRIITIVPDHKEALDSIYFLRGKPKDAPLRDDPRQNDDKNKPKLLLDEEKKGEKSSEKKKKKKKRRHSSATSSSSGSDSEDSKKPKKKRKKERKSRSKSRSKSQPRPVSPFSAKMAPGESGVPAGGVMNMPEEYQPSTQPTMNLPLPDLRQDIERIKSQRSQEESSGEKTPAKTVAPGFPMIDLTKPPPGWKPPVVAHAQMNDKEYDEKVRRFLQETAHGSSSSSHKRRSGHGERHRHRSRSRSNRRRSHRSSSRHRRRSKRSRSKSGDRKRRSKSRSKSNAKKEKSRSKSKEKILIEDDDFNKKLKDHLSSSHKKKSKSRSRERKRSKSRSRDRKKSRSRSKDRRSSRRSRSREHKSRRHSSRSKSREKKNDKDKEPENKDKDEAKQKVPSGSGMWIPTGEDSIVDGVKEAINKIEKKERRRSGDDRKSKSDEKPATQNVEYEIKYDRRTGMYTRVPKEQPKKPDEQKKEDIVEVESRTIRKISPSPPKVPSKKASPSRDKRSKSRDRRSRSRSKHRGRRSRSRHRSRSRRRRSRSRSRRRRSRSRSRHRHRSRSRHRSRRSRSRGRRSRSRSHKRRSRSKSSGWKDRSDHKAIQSSQNEKLDSKEEKIGDEAKTREKANLISGSGSSETPTKSDTAGQPKPGGDEFSSLDNVMNSVLEAVAPKPLEKNPPKPSTIIPGTQSFEDLEAFLKRKKSEKLEVMKKNL